MFSDHGKFNRKGQVSVEIIITLSILILGAAIISIFVFGFFNRNIDYSNTVSVSKDSAIDSLYKDLMNESHVDTTNVIVPTVYRYNLVLISNPEDLTVLSSSGNYPSGMISISANPVDGYNFVNWTDQEGNVVCSNLLCNFNLNEDKTLYANFSENIIYLSCPDGYVLVPGNDFYGTNDFCVMKYEAKYDSGTGQSNDVPTCITGFEDYSLVVTTKVKSVSPGIPLSNINLCAAKQACENSGGHLITNNEWMTVVRNIEQVPSNWSDGVVGSGFIPRGHSDGIQSLDGSNSLTGINKRTLILSNGDVIWDLAGNVWNWTSDVINYNPPPRYLDNGTLITDTINRWYDYSPNGGSGYYIDPNNLGSFPLEKKDLYLLDESYNSNNGIGRIYLRGTPIQGRSLIRGGYWGDSENAGILRLGFNQNTPETKHSHLGFRCVATPSVSQNPVYTLSVLKTGSGQGTVKGSLSGIDCGQTCSSSYDVGTLVTLTAAASTGHVFTGWSGEVCSGTDPCVVSITQAREVTANFQLNLLDFQHCLFTSSKCENSFLINGCGEGTVLDQATGLCWIRNLNPVSESNWQNAKNYCNNLNLAGHDDWKLPPINAIFTLFDLTRNAPYIIGGMNNIFLNGNGAYWSDSVVYNTPSSAWSVNIYNGGSEVSLKTNTYRVLCYRRM